VQDGRTIYRLRDDQFFISTVANDVEGITAGLTTAARKAEGLVTVTDMTHGRSQLLVIGPKAAELMSRLCGLDFQDSQFPKLAARQSSVAKTRQLILRQDTAELPAYALIGSRSLAAYLWRTTLEAGRDLRIAPIGQKTFDGLK
jgi:sarcosine oxidase subunit alpha